MCASLMTTIQNQRLLMGEFKETIRRTLDETKADPQTLSDLTDPDIGEEMINFQFSGWKKLIEFCDHVVTETLARRNEMLNILNNHA